MHCWYVFLETSVLHPQCHLIWFLSLCPSSNITVTQYFLTWVSTVNTKLMSDFFFTIDFWSTVFCKMAQTLAAEMSPSSNPMQSSISNPGSTFFPQLANDCRLYHVPGIWYSKTFWGRTLHQRIQVEDLDTLVFHLTTVEPFLALSNLWRSCAWGAELLLNV